MSGNRFFTNNIDKPEPSKKHGVFTEIAYAFAWLTALVGSAIGGYMLLNELESYSPAPMTIGIAVITIIGSWISASGVGVLAEISRKLTK